MRIRINLVSLALRPLLLLALTASSLLAQGSTRDWASYNRTWTSDRFSPLGEITRSNAASLHEVCAVDIPDGRSFQSGPLAVDGIIYVTTDMATYGIDGSTCAILWTNPHPYAPPSQLGAARGAAYLNGRLFRGSGDGHVFAIDAKSGTTLWDVPLADPKNGESIPMAPVAWNGMVFVGNAGGDNFGVTGRVYALSAADGKVVWELDSVPNTPEVRATWQKASAENPPTGGAFWTSFSLDAVDGTLYVSSGNPAPDFMKLLRPGRNLYTNSLIAIDARTGALRGYNQLVKDDFHDWDVSAIPAFVTTRGGHHIALTAGKDGYLRGLDLSAITKDGGESAVNGGFRYATPTTTHFNTKQAMSDKRPTRFCPGSQGGSEWNGAAYHPRLNLAYIGATDWCTTVTLMPVEKMKGEPGKPWSGVPPPAAFGKQDPKQQWKGWLTAVDADTGAVAWKFQAPTPLIAGVTPTGGDVVFTADLNGAVYAFDARTGKRLWKGNAGQPVGGGVISYEAAGRQRIAVAAGMKSPIWPVNTTTARVVVFGLP
jgi:alcohol dehydrogenase (cytochrome c)